MPQADKTIGVLGLSIFLNLVVMPCSVRADEASQAFERGNAAYGKGEYAKAIADLAEAVRLDPKRQGIRQPWPGLPTERREGQSGRGLRTSQRAWIRASSLSVETPDGTPTDNAPAGDQSSTFETL